jgi:DNA-binding NtrC family response regulator
MSPENANVFVIEDKEDWQNVIKMTLEDSGHTVVLTARTFDEAMAGITKLDELKVDVVTIDGNLDPNEYEGYEGLAILAEIKKRAAHIKTIGMGGSPLKGTDLDLQKSGCSKLGESVTKI